MKTHIHIFFKRITEVDITTRELNLLKISFTHILGFISVSPEIIMNYMKYLCRVLKKHDV